MEEFSGQWDAITYAFNKYDNLKRKSVGLPYVIHPIRVTMILRAAGFSEFIHKDLFLAALFHDLLEDTDLSYEDLKKEFGDHISSIVKELTQPNNLDKEKWLQSFDITSKEARIIKMADRIDNLLDMNSTGWTNEQQKSYGKQGLIILEKCRDTNQNLAIKLEEIINQILK